MSKSSHRTLFGPSRTGAVALVDAPVSRSYARKAKLAFLTVFALVAVFASVTLSLWRPVVAARRVL